MRHGQGPRYPRQVRATPGLGQGLPPCSPERGVMPQDFGRWFVHAMKRTPDQCLGSGREGQGGAGRQPPSTSGTNLNMANPLLAMNYICNDV